jgi:hypothetical protein
LEGSKSKRQYSVIGGKTILGKIFAYQEKTGMSVKDILKTPYIMFVIGMLDAPQVDYDSKTKDKTTTPKTAEDEAASLVGALG